MRRLTRINIILVIQSEKTLYSMQYYYSIVLSLNLNWTGFWLYSRSCPQLFDSYVEFLIFLSSFIYYTMVNFMKFQNVLICLRNLLENKVVTSKHVINHNLPHIGTVRRGIYQFLYNQCSGYTLRMLLKMLSSYLSRFFQRFLNLKLSLTGSFSMIFRTERMQYRIL